LVKYKYISSQVKLRKPYKLSELIGLIVGNYEKDTMVCFFQDIGCNLYTENYINVFDKDLICYIEECQLITDDDEEIFPQFVIDNNLKFFYSINNFEDVIFSALGYNKNLDIKDFIMCLEYYTRNDNFLEFN